MTNPLCGPRGASAVYGPQKGATPAMIESLDANLAHFAAIVRARPGRLDRRRSPARVPRAGWEAAWSPSPAAGSSQGIDLVIEAVNLAGRLAGADLCLTGEGALDDQSAFGKTAVGVARLARSLGCPTLALAGTIGPGAEATLEHGIDAYFSICPGPIGLERGDGPRRRAAGSGDGASGPGVPRRTGSDFAIAPVPPHRGHAESDVAR